MCGLCVWSHMTTGQDGFRNACSKHGNGLGGPMGVTEYHASWIDRSHHLLFSCKFTALAQHSSILIVLTVVANFLNCLCLFFRSPVRFAAHHKLPGNSGDLIRERHRHQLRFLPLQEFDQPS
jgi:hypothetical protein